MLSLVLISFFHILTVSSFSIGHTSSDHFLETQQVPKPPKTLSFWLPAKPWNGKLSLALSRRSDDDDDDDKEKEDEEDSPERAEFLPLSPEDRQRLSFLQSRQLTIPILFLDAMVPKQKLIFQSADPKFRRLLEACLDGKHQEAGMFGLNPLTRRPLCHGVSFLVNDDTIEKVDANTIRLTVTAERRLEVQGEPWLDETESYYMATVEVLDDREEEAMTDALQERTRLLSETLPALVKEWKEQVLQSKATDRAGLEGRCDQIGEMPTDYTERALWVAALINPLPPLGVSLEIRPAMLASENDYDRMLLACQALRSSIDHLSGKRRLF